MCSLFTRISSWGCVVCLYHHACCYPSAACCRTMLECGMLERDKQSLRRRSVVLGKQLVVDELLIQSLLADNILTESMAESIMVWEHGFCKQPIITRLTKTPATWSYVKLASWPFTCHISVFICHPYTHNLVTQSQGTKEFLSRVYCNLKTI